MDEGVTIKTVQDGTRKRLQAMLSRAGLLEGYLNRVVYERYKLAQKDRFETQNSSQGLKWADLDLKYAAAKKKKYGDYPGAGTHMMVASGRLFDAIIPGNKVVSNQRLIITASDRTGFVFEPEGKRKKKGTSSSQDYFEYADELRTFTTWSLEFMNKIKADIGQYLLRGKT